MPCFCTHMNSTKYIYALSENSHIKVTGEFPFMWNSRKCKVQCWPADGKLGRDGKNNTNWPRKHQEIWAENVSLVEETFSLNSSLWKTLESGFTITRSITLSKHLSLCWSVSSLVKWNWWYPPSKAYWILCFYAAGLMPDTQVFYKHRFLCCFPPLFPALAK